MRTVHEHRPSFWGFLFAKTALVNGRRTSLYRCRDCGAPLQVVPSQQKVMNLLPVIPLLLVIPVLFWRSSAPSLVIGLLSAGAYLLSAVVVYFIAYRFARFEDAPSR